MKLYYFAAMVGVVIIGVFFTHNNVDMCPQVEIFLDMGNYFEAAGILEKYDCPQLQKRYIESEKGDIIRYPLLKNQTVTIQHFISRSDALGITIRDLIDQGYSKGLIIKAAGCGPQDIDFCLMLGETLPELRPELTKSYGNEMLVAALNHIDQLWREFARELKHHKEARSMEDDI